MNFILIMLWSFAVHGEMFIAIKHDSLYTAKTGFAYYMCKYVQAACIVSYVTFNFVIREY